MRMRWMAVVVIAGAAIMPFGATAQVAGKWVAEISSPMLLEPAYARVSLERTGDTLTGMWGTETVKGSVKGSTVTITLTDAESKDAGSLTGKIEGDAGAGSGTMVGLGRRGGRRRCRRPRSDAPGGQLEADSRADASGKATRD
jgi:amidase